MKYCSFCQKIVDGDASCGRNNCPFAKLEKIDDISPGRTGSIDQTIQRSLDGSWEAVRRRFLYIVLTPPTIFLSSSLIVVAYCSYNYDFLPNTRGYKSAALDAFSYTGSNRILGSVDGQNKIKFSDGCAFRGEITDGQFNGIGELICPINNVKNIEYSRYRGNFENGAKNGQGVSESFEYRTDFLKFVNSFIGGFGTFSKKSYNSIRGNFDNNLPTGNLISTNDWSDQSCIERVELKSFFKWHDGALIESGFTVMNYDGNSLKKSVEGKMQNGEFYGKRKIIYKDGSQLVTDAFVKPWDVEFGIGADKNVILCRVNKDSYLYKNGLRAGDVLEKINDISIKNMNYAEISKLWFDSHKFKKSIKYTTSTNEYEYNY